MNSDLRITPEAVFEAPTPGDLLERVRRDLMAEDARMRSEVLPDPPEGWEWACELRTSDNDGIRGEVVVRLHYTLVEVA